MRDIKICLSFLSRVSLIRVKKSYFWEGLDFMPNNTRNGQILKLKEHLIIQINLTYFLCEKHEKQTRQTRFLRNSCAWSGWTRPHVRILEGLEFTCVTQEKWEISECTFLVDFTFKFIDAQHSQAQRRWW